MSSAGAAQRPKITSTANELRHWPKLVDRVRPHGLQSYCGLPLTM